MPIFFYSKSPEYGWLSNSSEHAFNLDNLNWPTVEHFYQAQKYAGTEAAFRIQLADSALKARKIGQDRSLTARVDGEHVKVEVMRRAVRAKFEQNRQLGRQLLDTGNEQLIHQSGSEFYWGRNQEGIGDNHLGVIIMEVRNSLRG